MSQEMELRKTCVSCPDSQFLLTRAKIKQEVRLKNGQCCRSGYNTLNVIDKEKCKILVQIAEDEGE